MERKVRKGKRSSDKGGERVEGRGEKKESGG